MARSKEEKAAWQAQRLEQERARGLYGNKRWNGSQWVDATTGRPIPKPPKPPNPFGPQGTISKTIDKALQKEINRKIAESAPKNATLVANVDSSCFEDLRWRRGVATATFWRGGAIVYDYDCSRDEFIDWVSDSLGGYFNEVIRE
jgi:hypothetical protein